MVPPPPPFTPPARAPDFQMNTESGRTSISPNYLNHGHIPDLLLTHVILVGVRCASSITYHM